MSLCLNLKIHIVVVKTNQLLGLIPLKSANQLENAYIIMRRTIKRKTFMRLLMIVLFSLSTRMGADL